MKWEKITTVIKGKQETQKLVSDDTSKVVSGKATREYYVLTDEEFRDSYDEKSLKQIPPNTEDQHLRELRQEGFCEYQSKRFVWAKTVSKEDMNFFRRGAATSTTFAYFEAPSYFEAPWGETVRVEMGDYLVMQYPTNGKQNDGVYRIGRDVFLQTYIDTANEVEEPPDSCSHAGARCFTKNCWDDSVMRHQFDLCRMFYHHPVAIEESDKKEADFKKRVKALQERMQLLKDLEIDENDPKMIEKYKAKRCNLRKALYELI